MIIAEFNKESQQYFLHYWLSASRSKRRCAGKTHPRIDVILTPVTQLGVEVGGWWQISEQVMDGEAEAANPALADRPTRSPATTPTRRCPTMSRARSGALVLGAS